MERRMGTGRGMKAHMQLRLAGSGKFPIQINSPVRPYSHKLRVPFSHGFHWSGYF